jgi:hypothetical protein
MKKIILIISLPIIVILYLVLSVYNPKPFISTGAPLGIDYELKEFSFFKPTYVSYQLVQSEDKFNVFFTELKRNKFLQWDINLDSIQSSTILKKDLENFRNLIKKNSNTYPTKVIQDSPLILQDKYEILQTDSFEQKESKRKWHPPARENSTHYNLDKFKLLKSGDTWPIIETKIGKGDFGIAPDDFQPNLWRLVYNIGSPKVSFSFITFKEGYPDINEESYKFPLLDIGFVTQNQEKVIVPVNPDGTYNWEAVKDKID